jgi:tight adherence protein B
MIDALVTAVAASSAIAFGAAAIRLAPSSRSGASDARRRRPPSAAAVTAGSAAVGGFVGSLLAGPIGVVILGAAGATVPSLAMRRARSRRSAATESQLLDLVVSLAAALRAGRSLEQALVAAAEEVGPPVGATIAAMTDEIELGTRPDAAVSAWAAAIATPEARLVAGVLALHRRTGGALAAPLDQLAATLRARRAAARELRSLTAQARLSAGILGLLPIGFFLFLATVSRSDIEAAVSTPTGLAAVVLGLVLQAAAFGWIRSLLRPGER